MTNRERFLESIEDGDLRDFFRTLGSSEQADVFQRAVIEDYPDTQYYAFDEETLDEMFSSPYECARAMHFGKVSWNDDWWFFNGYGNVETIADLEDYMMEWIGTMRDVLRDDYGDDICEYYGVEDSDEDTEGKE